MHCTWGAQVISQEITDLSAGKCPGNPLTRVTRSDKHSLQQNLMIPGGNTGSVMEYSEFIYIRFGITSRIIFKCNALGLSLMNYTAKVVSVTSRLSVSWHLDDTRLCWHPHLCLARHRLFLVWVCLSRSSWSLISASTNIPRYPGSGNILGGCQKIFVSFINWFTHQAMNVILFGQ